MSNLIITILSIGILAVLSYAGMYYGGSVFTAAVPRASATQLVAQAGELGEALRAFARNNGGNKASMTLPAWTIASGVVTSASLTPSYIQTFPATGLATNYWSMVLTDGTNVYVRDKMTPAGTEKIFGVYAEQLSLKQCEEINKLATGSTSIAQDDGFFNGGVVASYIGNNKFICLRDDTATGGGDTPYTFYYRAF